MREERKNALLIEEDATGADIKDISNQNASP